MPWQHDLAVEILERLRREQRVRSAELIGSAASSETLDRFSDVDVHIVLRGDMPMTALVPDSVPWALERRSNGMGEVVRMVARDGRRNVPVSGVRDTDLRHVSRGGVTAW